MPTNYISQIKTHDGTTYSIKDENTYTKNEIDLKINTEIANVAKYTILGDSEELPEANELTLLKRIYLKRDSVSNSLVEWICVRNGSEYKWEQLAKINLTDYLKIASLPEEIERRAMDTIREHIFDDTEVTSIVEFTRDTTVLVNNDNTTYSIPISRLHDTYTSQVYSKDNVQPISSRALNNYIKYVDVELNAGSYRIGGKNPGTLLSTITIDLTRVLNTREDLDKNRKTVNTVISCLLMDINDKSEDGLLDQPFFLEHSYHYDTRDLRHTILVDIFAATKDYFNGHLGTLRIFYI